MWTVGSQTLSATGPVYSSISQVGVRAEVAAHPTETPGQEGDLLMEWREVTVTFYDAADQAIPLPFDANCSPRVNLLDRTQLALKQQTFLFTPPDGYTAVRAVVVGQVR